MADAARASLSAAARDGRPDARGRSFALSLIGIDYRYGGDTPDRGLDCSGLIRYVFQEVTGVTLPRTAKELSRLGTNVRAVISTRRPRILQHAPFRVLARRHLSWRRPIHPRAVARRRGGRLFPCQRYWQKRFDGARRLVGVLPAMVPTLISAAVAARPIRRRRLQTALRPAWHRIRPLTDRADGASRGYLRRLRRPVAPGITGAPSAAPFLPMSVSLPRFAQ